MAMSRQEMEALIVQRAWKDEAFRAEFLADAKGTIEKYSGEKLPDDLRVLAHPEDAQTVHFVIPPKPRNADELSDEDLEKVAGGVDIIFTPFIALGVFVAGLVAVGGAAAGTQSNHGW